MCCRFNNVSGEKRFFNPKMEALQFDSKKKTLSLVKTDVPTITENNEVLVKVVYAGVCGTDLHIIDVSTQQSSNPLLYSCYYK